MLCSYRVCQILLQGIPSVESEEELVWLRQSCIGSATKELKCLLTLCLAVVTAFLFFFFFLSSVNYWYDMEYDLKYSYYQLLDCLTKAVKVL